jgi:hypothetical protein
MSHVHDWHPQNTYFGIASLLEGRGISLLDHLHHESKTMSKGTMKANMVSLERKK